MNTLENIREQFHQLQVNNGTSLLTQMEQSAFEAFNRMGIPTARNEEWKYTRVNGIFNMDYVFSSGRKLVSVTAQDIDAIRLPGSEDADELVFVNGVFSPSLSKIKSAGITVQSLEQASANEYGSLVMKHLGYSNRYEKNGIHALNSAFVQEGTFIHVRKDPKPVFIYQVTDARGASIFSQPRTLIYVAENVHVKFVETFATLGQQQNLINQVVEVVVEQNAIAEYYKIQNDAAGNSQVTTTQFRQIGRSSVHAVTVTLGGAIVRNNLNLSLEAEHAEGHLYGLYFIKGDSHVDNHTIVDNIEPHCLSNELYKGVIDGKATAVFNGKIYVQPQAQKTNAFQSNKNILLSDTATVNTKPQLEIFADDVKCSHGCTVGQLDEEGLFYLRSRGISESVARSLLVRAFASDILEHIKLEVVRDHVEELISSRLQINEL